MSEATLCGRASILLYQLVRMTTDLISDALTMAWFRRRPGAGLILHSDRGSQYCSHSSIKPN